MSFIELTGRKTKFFRKAARIGARPDDHDYVRVRRDKKSVTLSAAFYESGWRFNVEITPQTVSLRTTNDGIGAGNGNAVQIAYNRAANTVTRLKFPFEEQFGDHSRPQSISGNWRGLETKYLEAMERRILGAAGLLPPERASAKGQKAAAKPAFSVPAFS